MKKNLSITTQKEIDSLGRVVIPQRYREHLGIQKNTTVDLVLNKNNIEIKPRRKACALCQGYKNINEEVGLCGECIRMVKELDSFAAED